MDILAARKKAQERTRAAETVQENAAAAMQEPKAPEASSAPVLEEEALQKPEPAQTPPSAAAEPDLPPDEPEKKEQEPSDEKELEMLAFFVGRERYVVPVDAVREVLKPREITPVPHTPDYILGVCSLRGAVLTVIDLNRRLGLASAQRDEKSRIIIVTVEQDEQIGLFVDMVEGVVRFSESLVKPVPETVEHGVEFLQGIVRKDERLYILLDVAAAVGAAS